MKYRVIEAKYNKQNSTVELALELIQQKDFTQEITPEIKPMLKTKNSRNISMDDLLDSVKELSEMSAALFKKAHSALVIPYNEYNKLNINIGSVIELSIKVEEIIKP